MNDNKEPAEPVPSTDQPDSTPVSEQPVGQQPLTDTAPANSATEPSSNQVVTPPPKRSKKKLLVTVGVVLVMVLAASAGAWALTRDNTVDPGWSSEAESLQPAPITESSEVVASYEPSDYFVRQTVNVAQERERFSNPQTGEVWLSKPEKLPSQGVFDASTEYSKEYQTQYYKMGTRGGKDIIFALEQSLGYQIDIFEKSVDGTLTYIMNPNKNWKFTEKSVEDKKLNFRTKDFPIDETTGYDSLSYPYSLDIGNNQVIYEPEYPSLGMPRFIDYEADPNETVLKTFGESEIRFRGYTYPDTQLTNLIYSVVTPAQLYQNYAYKPVDNSLEGVVWVRGAEAVTENVYAIARGCGVSGVSATQAEAVKDADFVPAGKQGDEVVWYEFADPNNVLLQKAYEEYTEFYKGVEGTTLLTKEEFIAQHGIVAHKDAFDRWLVYTRDGLRPAGGCAKPVVYLYPEATTEVSVRVGADVTVSEPFYDPMFGWRATAEPSGRLTVNDAQYESLFWEGYGYGEYPEVRGGVVVPTDQAVQTMRQQLALLGLNHKESEDFIVFWQDKLPNKPYTRLTWFTTEQLDRLAPLTVVPKPDTVIRVFLDMEGAVAPYFLLPQLLESTPRRGFTVVEWGGLAGFVLK